MRDELRAEPFIEPLMRALDQQMIVERPENGREAVRIGEAPDGLRVRRRETVGRAGGKRRQPLEEAVGVDALEWGDRDPLRRLDLDGLRAGDQRADDVPACVSCGPSKAKGSP